MTAANPSHAQALVITDELVRCGVSDAVLAPGSRSTALAMALHDEPRIRLHVEIDERSAGFLAVGIGRATGRGAVVLCTSGSATANLHPAVVEADTGRVPLLVLTADRPPELRHTAANQTIDQVGLYGGAVRWTVDLGVAEDRADAVVLWRSTIARAVAEAQGVRTAAGPVHVNLPFREPTVPAADDGRSRAAPFAQPLDGRPGGAPWTAVVTAARAPDPALVARLVDRVAATERGLVVVGETTAAAGPIVDLACRAGWPLVAEPHSGARSGPNAISTAHHLLGVEGFARSHRPDLVIRIGRPGLSPNLGRLLGADVPQVLVDADGAWLDPGRSIRDLVVADPGATCAALADALSAPTTSDWLDAWRAADAEARHAIDTLLDADDTPTEPRVARDVAAAVPAGGVLVAASSMPIRDLDRYQRPREPVRVIANRGASGIDGFVSTVLGVALAAGPTTALAGDLSLLHDSNGFLLSPDVERVDAVFVVVNNDGGGIFHLLPQAGYPSFERLFGTPHGRDLSALAALHRIGHARVERAGELSSAVDGAREAGGVHLVEVPIDRHAAVDLRRRVQAAVADAIG